MKHTNNIKYDEGVIVEMPQSLRQIPGKERKYKYLLEIPKDGLCLE